MYSTASQQKSSVSNQRLIRAAANEKLSSKKHHKYLPIRSNEDNGLSRREERETTEEITSDDDFFVRCNITVVTNNIHGKQSDSECISKVTNKRADCRSRGARRKRKKNVRFHKYDEVIYADVTEYIYSLHDLEVEHEKANRDLVDDIEGVVGDVGYFLRCLKEGIEEEAAKSLVGDRVDIENHACT